jgi:hypothetical protein
MGGDHRSGAHRRVDRYGGSDSCAAPQSEGNPGSPAERPTGATSVRPYPTRPRTRPCRDLRSTSRRLAHHRRGLRRERGRAINMRSPALAVAGAWCLARDGTRSGARRHCKRSQSELRRWIVAGATRNLPAQGPLSNDAGSSFVGTVEEASDAEVLLLRQQSSRRCRPALSILGPERISAMDWPRASRVRKDGYRTVLVPFRVSRC